MKVSAILVALLVVGSALAAGTATASAMSTSQASQLAQLEATAKSAQAAIEASPTDLKAMVSAIKMRSVAQARSILVRHGFTAAQLEGGIMVFSHALLPKQVKPSQYYYFELANSPLKIEVLGLPPH
ncbi:MAG: hypothetical protein WB615_08495 [Candidatus Tumulicola sp.]